MPKLEEIDYMSARTWESANFQNALDRAGSAHSDGSGGSNDTPQCMRKVAFGAVSFDIRPDADKGFCLEELACIGGKVPDKQTVPRAELWGAIQTIIRADPTIDLEVGIDASYVTNGVNKRNVLLKGPNGDLWSILFDIIDLRQGTTTLTKVKSHLDEKGPEAIQSKQIRFDHLVGNTLADKVAGAAVIRAQQDASNVSKAKKSYTTAFCVAKRLAIIQADIWKTRQEAGDIYDLDFWVTAHEVDQAQTTAEMCEQLALAGHRLVKTSKGHRCVKCCKSRHTKHFIYWSQNACRPRPPAECIITERKRKWVEAHKENDNSDDNYRFPRLEATLCAGTDLETRQDNQTAGKETPDNGETEPATCTKKECKSNKRKRDEVSSQSDEKETADAETSSWLGEETADAETFPKLKSEKKDDGRRGRPYSGGQAHAQLSLTIFGGRDVTRTQSTEKETADVETSPWLREETTDAETLSQLQAGRQTERGGNKGCQYNISDTPKVDNSDVQVTVARGAQEAPNSHAQPSETVQKPMHRFDDPEDDTPFSDESEAGCPWDGPEDLGLEEETVLQDGGDKAPAADKGGKRLRKKTNRLLTAYSNKKPRGNWQDQRRRKRENAKVIAADRATKKAAARTALNHSFKNVSATNRETDVGSAATGPDYDWEFAEAIDPSHVIVKVHPNSNAIYCQRCSYFNNGGPLRGLKGQCPLSIPKSRASLFKMLRNGTVPTGVEHLATFPTTTCH